jgi:serine/threonine protein kinase
VRPLLDGLEAIHRAGFLHRDIKPGNIYMRADGSPVLLDFGSARRVENEDGQDQALTAVVTPGFGRAVPPPRQAGALDRSVRLAGVMYWMVTGKLPVEAFARLREDNMPPAAGIGNVDAFGLGLLNAIDWALNPDEDKRPRQVADFRRACLAPPPAARGRSIRPSRHRCPGPVGLRGQDFHRCGAVCGCGVARR